MTPYYRPFSRNFLTALSQWKCLLLTLLIDICIVSMCWCKLSSNSSEKHSFRIPMCHYDYLYIPSAFFILFYLIYLIECWKCHLRLELSHPIDVQSAYTYISQLKSTKPELFWRVSCFHYSRSNHAETHVLSANNNNNIVNNNNQGTYEKVVSEMCCGKFTMRNLCVVDGTMEANDLEYFALTKLHLRKKITFQTSDIEEVYNNEKKMFLQPFQFKDDFIEVIDGIETYNNSKCSTLLVTNHSTRQPFLISNKLHVICALALLSWPLRLIIICKTAHVYVNCTKSIEPKLGNQDNECEQSSDVIDNLPPSYSEALKLCQPDSHDKSIIFCNRTLLRATKYQDVSSSSDESIYSLEMDLDTRERRNRFDERRRTSVTQCFNNLMTSARKIAHSYQRTRDMIRRSWTFTQNKVSEHKNDIKRDISLPINVLSAEILLQDTA